MKPKFIVIMQQKYFITAVSVAVVLFVSAGGALQAQQLVRGLESRQIQLFAGDSIQVDILYSENDRAPFIIFLPDRFGVQPALHQIMRAFADAGYHTAALHIAIDKPSGGSDSTTLDEDNAARIIEAVVEIRNDPRSGKKTGLMAFDIGATAGMLAETRIPLFSACAMFYPSDRDVFLNALQKCNVPVEINVCREGSVFPERDMLDIKRRFMSKTNPILFRYYDAGRYFCNPGYAGFDENALRRGLSESAGMFRQFLR